MSAIQSVWSFVSTNVLNFLGASEPHFDILVKLMVVHMLIYIFTSAGAKKLTLHILGQMLLKKLTCLVVIGVAGMLDGLLGMSGVHSVVTFYFIAMEGMSILDVAKHLGVPIPPQLVASLEHLRDESETIETDTKTTIEGEDKNG